MKTITFRDFVYAGVIVAGIAGVWGALSTSVNSQSIRTLKLESKVEPMETQLAVMNNRLENIEKGMDVLLRRSK